MHYSPLNDEKDFDYWRRKTEATDHAHGCSNVLDPLYVPTNDNDKFLFREQNTFMYDVFLSKVETHMGTHYIRQHEDDRDAQLFW